MGVDATDSTPKAALIWPVLADACALPEGEAAGLLEPAGLALAAAGFAAVELSAGAMLAEAGLLAGAGGAALPPQPAKNVAKLRQPRASFRRAIIASTVYS